MHADEVETDAGLVRRLLAAQFPRWAELPLVRVPSDGTDNALYRLGDDMVVRLPRIHWAVDNVEREQEWLPRLAPHLPVPWGSPPGQDRRVWVHGDVAPGNLLLVEGRLSAVIDFGGVGVGDPAADLIVAWNLLPAEARAVLREETGVDEDTWARGRGLALSVALLQLPYYAETNPTLAENSRHVLGTILGGT